MYRCTIVRSNSWRRWSFVVCDALDDNVPVSVTAAEFTISHSRRVWPLVHRPPASTDSSPAFTRILSYVLGGDTTFFGFKWKLKDAARRRMLFCERHTICTQQQKQSFVSLRQQSLMEAGLQIIIVFLIFTARRYASAVYAVVVCLDVSHTPVLYCSHDPFVSHVQLWT